MVVDEACEKCALLERQLKDLQYYYWLQNEKLIKAIDTLKDAQVQFLSKEPKVCAENSFIINITDKYGYRQIFYSDKNGAEKQRIHLGSGLFVDIAITTAQNLEIPLKKVV